MVKSFLVTVSLILTLGTVHIWWPDETIGSTTFTRVSVQAVDTSAHRLTFRTMEGQVWTVSAASPEILKDLHTGDICSLEMDSDDRVTKVVKADAP